MLKIILPIHYLIEYKTKKDKKVLVGMNWARNAHFHLLNKVKKHYHGLVKEQLTGEKFNTISPIYAVYVGNVLTDGGNVRSMIEKFFLDALVENGAIVNDTLKYVTGDTSKYYLDRKNPRIEISIGKPSTK